MNQGAQFGTQCVPNSMSPSPESSAPPRQRPTVLSTSQWWKPYWNIGWMILEDEKQGKERAEYGAFLMEVLSQRLQKEFGKGFTERNLHNSRQFCVCFPIRHAVRAESPEGSKTELTSGAPETILSALRRELSWTHYRLLMSVENPKARAYYLNEAADQNWSTRALERQINSLYYERLAISRDQAPTRKEAKHDTVANNPEGFQPLAGGHVRSSGRYHRKSSNITSAPRRGASEDNSCPLPISAFIITSSSERRTEYRQLTSHGGPAYMNIWAEPSADWAAFSKASAALPTTCTFPWDSRLRIAWQK